MIKYLKCESKARAMGISRETYVSFVESMGYTYSNSTHSDSAYGYIEKVSIIDDIEVKEYALVVDDSQPYYNNLPDVLKGRLIEREVLESEGWFPVIEE
jgi:hypothetical protein